MFAGCTNIMGGNGTTFDSSVVDVKRAVADTVYYVDGSSEDSKGYLTLINQKESMNIIVKYQHSGETTKVYDFQQVYCVSDVNKMLTLQGANRPSFVPDDIPEGMQVSQWKSKFVDERPGKNIDLNKILQLELENLPVDKDTGFRVYTFDVEFGEMPTAYAL